MRAQHPARRLVAFTLVELLVVIGIIALLIAALLPALNTARQQANSIDCQSRLRTIGQALGIYLVDSKGTMPWGAIGRSQSWISPAFTSSNDDREGTWWWYYTLNNIMVRSKNVDGQGYVNRMSKVFTDRDTIDIFGEVPTWQMHYTANPRLMPFNGDGEFAPNVFAGKPVIFANDFHTLKASSIKTPNVFVIWDGPQCAVLPGGQPGSAYGVASTLDANAYTFGHAFCNGSPKPIEVVDYDRPVIPGELPYVNLAAYARSTQIQWNRDLRHAFDRTLDGFKSHLRFRHLKNKSLNALCMDGHVESRRVGEASLRDFCINYPF